jgi:hypothetical protein
VDAGITIRPVQGVAHADYARPASVPVQNAVATDLDPSQTVTAAAAASNIRHDPLSTQDAQSRVTLIDPATRDVILRVIDSRTHQVIRQVPEQALLRMRAYARALQRGETSGQAEYQADIAV